MAISRFAASRVTQGLPKYQSAWDQDGVAQGAIEPIAFGTITAATGDFTFTNIPQNYQDLMIVVTGRGTNAAVDGGIYIGFSGQYGGNTNYSFTQMYANGTSIASQRATNQPFVGGDGAWTGATAAAGIIAHGIINVFDYASTNKFKTYLLRSSNDINASGSGLRYSVGTWRNTSAITSMYITFSGTMVNGTTAAIYGIKAGV